MQPTLLLVIQGWCPSCSNATHLTHLLLNMIQGWCFSCSKASHFATLHDPLKVDALPAAPQHCWTAQLVLLYSVLYQLSCPAVSKCIFFKQNLLAAFYCKLFSLTVSLSFFLFTDPFWQPVQIKNGICCTWVSSSYALNSQSYNDWLVVLH